MYEKFLIQAATQWLVAHAGKPERIAQLKSLLVKLHDVIEYILPQIQGQTPAKRLATAQAEIDKAA